MIKEKKQKKKAKNILTLEGFKEPLQYVEEEKLQEIEQDQKNIDVRDNFDKQKG